MLRNVITSESTLEAAISISSTSSISLPTVALSLSWRVIPTGHLVGLLEWKVLVDVNVTSEKDGGLAAQLKSVRGDVSLSERVREWEEWEE